MSLSYEGGAVFSFMGSKIGDRFGHRKTAIIGNSFIPLLSLSALANNPVWAISLLTHGWWARNFRSPSRRVMLSDAVKSEEFRARTFGFLHALDVGGAALAAMLVLIAFQRGATYRIIFLATALPLAASTLMLFRSNTAVSGSVKQRDSSQDLKPKPSRNYKLAKRSIFLSSALYGFTFYSIGFPILTVAQKTHSSSIAISSFLLFQAVSAATGYFGSRYFGKHLFGRFMSLALMGYLASALRALVITVDILLQYGTIAYLIGLALLGFALGVIETLEPALISELTRGSEMGRGFGLLSSYRSVGLFVGNLLMGPLYQLAPYWSYTYAAAVALCASVVLLFAAISTRRFE